MYDFWDSLDNRTTGQQVSSITEVISAIFKNGDKKDIQTIKPFHFLNLDNKIYTTIIKNGMQKP